MPVRPGGGHAAGEPQRMAPKVRPWRTAPGTETETTTACPPLAGRDSREKTKETAPNSHNKNHTTPVGASALACPSVVRRTKAGRARLWVSPEMPPKCL